MTKKENKLILYTDGGSRGNPGPAGCGVFITSLDSSITERRFKYLGIATNNIAEYMGGLLGIQRGIELGATEIELRADSKLMIEQLSGNYKVKNPELKKIWLQIHEMLSNWWGKIIFTHVYREDNREADRLSNVAMDQGK
jgi:ribonuclease HI